MASSSTEISSKEYTKRTGTSGIRGHLYETKLLSLIYFRAIHNDSIEEFHLATNVAKLGSFDDICFRAKVKGCYKPVAVFIQAKHREKNNSVLTLNSKCDLAKYFNSYLDIRRKFQPDNTDVLFKGKFSETKCLFVIYTTTKGDIKTRKFKGSFAKHLNAVIGTGDPGSQISYSDENKELLCKIVLEKEITALAQNMAKCIYGELNDSQMLMQDELVLRYHVILAQKVFDVSDDQSEGYRIARFRKDFFDIHEGFLRLFKDELCTEILKRRKVDYLKKIMFLFSFLTLRESPDIEGLYKQFGSGIIYKNGKFEFLDKRTPGNCELVLEKINKSQKTIRKTVVLAVKECLPSLEFKVPASFGNKDLTIKGGDEKIERKLKDLTFKIVGLIEKSIPSNIIIIDESMGKGFLQLSGGIASAVGNLLVFDDTTKLIKFNDNYESLPELAKKLFDKLKGEVNNLTEYKFNIKTKIFPKLSFIVDEHDKNIVSDFFRGLLFYTSQSNEENVEKKLIHEINNSQYDDVQNIEITPDAIFLKYHDEIQKWWMKPIVGTYLTKEGNLYKNAVKHVTSQSLVGVLNMMQRIKNKNYTFTEDAVNSIKLQDQPSGTIIVTENSALTVTKLTQHLNNKYRFVLDLEYILNLSARDDKILRTELMNTNEVKRFFVIFDKALITTSSNRKIKNIAKSIKDRIIVIITNQNSVEMTKKYFSQTDNVITDLRNSLIDMSEESQKNILENTKVVFQGYEVGLDQILDNESIGYVRENILYKILHSYKNIIGKPIRNTNYISKLYIQRTVQCFKVVSKTRVAEGICNRMSTLYDITDDVVLIIGDPGMGKSTLLTHLSLKTKESYPLLWILRINLLEYSRQFSEWQEDKTDIDTLESLKFMCQVALSEESSKKNVVEITLEESNDIVYLKDCKGGDEWTVLELKMFLNYYNTKNIIILFDGFDEICPTYTFEVLTLIKAVKNWPRKHKMWITSRSYDKIITILELQFGTLYKILPLRNDEQYDYLTTFWDEKEILKDLNDVQRQNIFEFSMFMSEKDDIDVLMKKNHLRIQSKKEMPFIEVYLCLVKYLRSRIKPKHLDSMWTRKMDKSLLGDWKIAWNFQPKLYVDTMVALNTVYNKIPSLFFNKLVATPLHLNMTADYLYNKIRDTSGNHKWDLDTNTFDIYEYFLETKLKRIRFQEKNQNDMSKPDNISHYKRVYADVVDKHKKLAAFAVFDRCLFDKNELKQFREVLNELKEGEERTGIICNVVNDIPIFVHSSFAEYFAVEYICDLLKSKENSKPIWDFIFNIMFFNCNMNILVTLDAKMKIDKELTTLIERNKKIIFELLLEQSKNFKTKHGTIKSSLCEAIRHDLRYIGGLFLSTIEDNLDESNLMDFIEIVKETNILLIAVKMEFEALIVTTVNHVRIIDKSKLSLLFENIETIELNENIDEVSTDELVQKLHRHVWARMDIVPDWANLSELSGQIYFI